MIPFRSEDAPLMRGGHVKRTDRRQFIPSGGESSAPFATKYNEHQVAPGLPTKQRMHRQHYQVYGEHKEAFANSVGTARRNSIAMNTTNSNRNNTLHYSNQGGFARKQRDLERLRAKTYQEKTHSRHQDALNSTATQLSASKLNPKSLFQHFDRNQDGTINFNSFSNGLRLAGVKTTDSVQREMFDASANNGRLDYKRFVNDMKIQSNRIHHAKTSLDIEDPSDAVKYRKEQLVRDKKFGDNKNQRSNSIMPGSSHLGDNNTHDIQRRLAWNDLSRGEQQQHLTHDRVMRVLQEKYDQVEAAFVAVDKQRDGCLNKTEFQQGLKRVGITLSPQDATSFFAGLPRGPNGLLDYHQFAQYLHRSNVTNYSAGQVRATNYTKKSSKSHIVQQRVADAVASKRKDLEIVFREKDQGRGGRDSLGRKDGQVTIRDVDDVLKSCGVILSVSDTERLFDRVDVGSTGVVSYQNFLKATCGEYAVDLKESTEDKKRRVRHLRSWNAISGDKDNGDLLEDTVVKESWQSGRRPSMVSVTNPANVLQKKERDQLVTQQRIVNLYAKHAVELKEVFSVHQDEPIDMAQFLRGTQLAGMQIAPSDAQRLFSSLSAKDPATGRSYMDGKNFIKSLESYDMSKEQHRGRVNMDKDGQHRSKNIVDESEAQHAHDHGLFGAPPPLPLKNQNSVSSFANRQHHHYTSDPTDKKTTEWMEGDQLLRQERLASEKLLRKITIAATPSRADHRGRGHQLSLEQAFQTVKSVQDGFVDMDGFQEGMSNLGVQLSRKDCKDLFSHFQASETDTLSIHSFTALVCDRQRTEQLGATQGIQFQAERHSDHRILLDAWGVPSHVKMSDEDDSENGQHSGRRSGIQHGRINNVTVAKDVTKRLRVIAPDDPESARQYMLYVFRKHASQHQNKKGTISHTAFRHAMANFDSTFTGRRSAAVIDIHDTQHSGRINYYKFVDAVLNVDRAKHEQVPKTTGSEQNIRRNEAKSKKRSDRLNWSKHRWNSFQNHWVEKHGRSAVKELQRDASVAPSGESWSSAPQHKQPFRILHSSVRAPPSPLVGEK